MKAVPYFPFYAANFIASRAFRLMTLEERGLWITIQMECWVNGSIPSDSKELARYLGVSHEEVQRSFTQKQFSFLQKIGDEFKSPELEEQREIFMERREKQRLGGQEGAKRKKAKQATGNQFSSIGIPEGQPKGSLIQFNSASIESTPTILNKLSNRELTEGEFNKWLDDTEDAPDITGDYRRQSRG